MRFQTPRLPRGNNHLTWLSIFVFVFLLLGTSPVLAASGGHGGNAHGSVEAASFPPSLDSYEDDHLESVGEILKNRISKEPFNLVATIMFLCAVFHTFMTHRFRHIAHTMEERHHQHLESLGDQRGSARSISMGARLFHFLGEVEAVFGIWVIPLMLWMVFEKGGAAAVGYLDTRVSYHEPIFVVIIMAISSTRPVLRLAESIMSGIAGRFGGTAVAYWFSVLTVGPLLGSFITEPAAMTIAASLLARHFYQFKPRKRFAYATLGLLFVNVSVGGTLTHFAAPPVLMVAKAWGWNTLYMLEHFGWVAATGIVISNGLYFLVFRKDFAELQAAKDALERTGNTGMMELPVPAWVTLVHVIFMGLAVKWAHHPVMLIGSFLFFIAFFEITEDYQGAFQLRSPILVGFFLAGLVIHGGLQQWWIAPVLGNLSETPLMFGAIGLTAFNDNAAITYLATLVPDLSNALKQAVAEGAVIGGGLTVIANAPNPAGQAILGKFFEEGIAPLGLLAGALLPTIVQIIVFMTLGALN